MIENLILVALWLIGLAVILEWSNKRIIMHTQLPVGRISFQFKHPPKRDPECVAYAIMGFKELSHKTWPSCPYCQVKMLMDKVIEEIPHETP